MTHNGHLSPKKWLTLTWNGQFHLICNFSNHFPPKAHFSQNSNIFVLGGVHQPIFPDSQLLELFPMEAAQNDPQWPILPPKWLELTQNGQFWSVCNFSHLFPQIFSPIFSPNHFPPKQLIFCKISKYLLGLGEDIGQFSRICNFLNCFPPKWLKMTQNGH